MCHKCVQNFRLMINAHFFPPLYYLEFTSDLRQCSDKTEGCQVKALSCSRGICIFPKESRKEDFLIFNKLYKTTTK